PFPYGPWRKSDKAHGADPSRRPTMNDKPKDKPPTSRFGRLARLAGLGTKGIPLAFEGAKRVLGRERPKSPEEIAEESRRLKEETKKAAEAMLKTLGDMKGLPLKV